MKTQAVTSRASSADSCSTMPECLKVRDMDFHPNLISDQSHVMISFLFYQGARKIVHDLIFCSMLLENEFKRLFALEFTKVITK